MSSIRRSLVVGTIAVSAVSILLAGFFLYRIVHTQLYRQFDGALASRARALASTIEVTEGELVFDFVEFDMDEFEDDDAPSHLQLWSNEGEVLYRSPALGDADLAGAGALPAGDAATTTVLGRKARAFKLGVDPRLDEDDDEDEEASTSAGTSPVVLVLARDLAEIDSFLSRLLILFLIAGAAVVVVTALVLAAVVRRSLNPLDQLATEIAALDSAGGRVNPPQVPAEIAPVVSQLNDLLTRVEQSVERERSFSADVAHELRTPLAGLRSLLDVALSRTREGAEYAETLEQSRDITRRLQALMQKLLYLYRLESGQIDAEFRDVELAGLVDAVLESLAAEVAQRELKVDSSCAPGLSVHTDPMLLEIAVKNVVENAVVHSDRGGGVRVTARRNGSTVLVVANTGSAIAPDAVADVTERFYRGDAARGAEDEHWGLGLAIVARVAETIEAGLEIDSTEGGDFVVTLRFER